MKMLILLISMMISLSANEFLTNDFWYKEDKQKHFLGSASIAVATTGLARHYGSNKVESFLIGVGSTIIVGWLKEVSDGQGHGSKDINDIDADMLGAVTGSMISTQFKWRF
jgi:uncharacterized protein YfiM (DUF2279 family)